MTLRDRMRQLEAARPQVDARIRQACQAATMRAVEKAAALTPMKADNLSGTNTRSDQMKQHWATDSKTRPEKSGNRYETLLANDKPYASFVNDGHNMNRHFVPGLYVNPYSGLLEYDPAKDTGIVVGTKTPYVPGLFMTEQAIETYRQVLRQELDTLGEVFG